MASPITVSQLNRYVTTLLENDPKLQSIMVSGELSGFKSYSSGHLYFTLKDDKAAVNCVMFKGYAAKLKFKPENGVQVIVKAKASLYDRDGRFQLYINSMQREGMGDLHLAFERMKEKLKSQGLFAQEAKKTIPFLPHCIGVVTSESGAVIRDIINVCRRRFPGFKLQLIPVSVQGTTAAAEIASAIEQFNQLGQADVLIVGRGGGSMEDLWAFNEEIVARAVFASDIPIISAVGHETDFTICDFVADLRAPTPSAAAELVIPQKSELIFTIADKYEQMRRVLHKSIEMRRLALDSLTSRPVLRSPIEQINRRREFLDRLEQRLEQAHQYRFAASKHQIQLLASKLDALSPLKVLSRGYALVTDRQETPIQSVSNLHAKDTIKVLLQDGDLVCSINEVNDRRMS